MAFLLAGATGQTGLWIASCPSRCLCPCLMAAKFGEGRLDSKDDYRDRSEMPKHLVVLDKRGVGEVG